MSDAAEVRALIDAVRAVHVADAIKAYAVDLAEATRQSPRSASAPHRGPPCNCCARPRRGPRSGGREYVIPDDLQGLTTPVLAHRLLLTAEAQIAAVRPRTR